LWEPWVSKALENPNVHVVVDSSRFRGYIVDVIVVNREYLVNNSDAVKFFVQAYFRTVYMHKGQMLILVIDDAKSSGTPLSTKQAQRLVDGVWWKNTSENYEHMGLGADKLQHIEDIIGNITNVLVSTGSISGDPTNGKPNLLYYDKILADMQVHKFHPGMKAETVRDDSIVLPALTDKQWDTLIPVGKLEVPQLVFARGTARLSSRSATVLDGLIEKLKTWPQFYVLVRGNASKRGDLEANKALALARATAAKTYLVNKGVSPNRVRAAAGEPSGSTSVNFVLGQTPY